MALDDQRFETFAHWVEYASTVLTERGPAVRTLCVDAKGRRCRIGADFMRARDEGAFPVRWYWPEQITAAGLDCIVSDVMLPREVPEEEREEAPEDEGISKGLTRWVLETQASHSSGAAVGIADPARGA